MGHHTCLKANINFEGKKDFFLPDIIFPIYSCFICMCSTKIHSTFQNPMCAMDLSASIVVCSSHYCFSYSIYAILLLVLVQPYQQIVQACMLNNRKGLFNADKKKSTQHSWELGTGGHLSFCKYHFLAVAFSLSSFCHLLHYIKEFVKFQKCSKIENHLH